MADNPLTDRLAKTAKPKLTPHEWADRGNAHLASIGRHDVEWFVKDGKVQIGWRKSAAVMIAEDRRAA